LYLLDTDVLSLFLHRRAQHPLLEERIFSTPPELRFVSVVTAEEMIQGAFKVIRRELQTRTGVAGYTLLKNMLEDLRSVQLLDVDAGALSRFLAFPADLRRIGRSDCLIAASALERDFTVVTRNLSDFTRFPGLRVEDWTDRRAV
jgi:tRNA(fMet)-specific endonuclease VapC